MQYFLLVYLEVRLISKIISNIKRLLELLGIPLLKVSKLNCF